MVPLRRSSALLGGGDVALKHQERAPLVDCQDQGIRSRQDLLMR